MSGTLKKASFPVAKDDQGNPVLICLDDQGRVPVTSEPPGTCFKTPYACVPLTETGDVPDEVQVGEVTINADEEYACVQWSVSTTVDAKWTIKRIDDADGTPAPTVIHEWITGPANPHDCCKVDCLDFNTNGGTGTQKFVLCATAISADCLGPALGFAATLEQG
jgi:hypothetical protein